MGRAVGIDLGTTNSVVAVLEAGQVTVIPNAEGARTTPSVVAFGPDGLPLVGEVAKRQAVTNTERTVRSVKRHVGTDWEVLVDAVPYAPSQVLALILSKLRRDAEAYLGEPVTDAVVTVPAYFSDAQRQATKDAGEIAGLTVSRIINEPTAAALAYGAHLTDGQNVLVFDLGGGTFDVSLLAVEKEDDGFTTVQVLATSGDNHLGGDDWDQCLVDLLAEDFDADHGTDIRQDPVARQRLLEAAEAAKITLSSTPVADINLPYLAMTADGPLHLATEITRARFEAASHDLLQRCRGPLDQVLADAALPLDAIDHVVLVGGATRMPAVSALVRDLAGRDPFKGVNPDEVVAAGAATQAGVLAGDRDDVLLIDVTPFDLGIETRSGKVAVLIERNTAIPVRRSRTFTTSSDDQDTVLIRVFQGTEELAADNTLLGNFALTPIAAAPKGTPQIEVTFDIDANGIVSVSATDLANGNAQEMAVTGTSTLTGDQVAAAAAHNADMAARDQARHDELTVLDEAARLVRQARRDAGDGPSRTPAEPSVLAHAELVETLLDSDGRLADDALDALRDLTAQLRDALTAARDTPEAAVGGADGAGSRQFLDELGDLD